MKFEAKAFKKKPLHEMVGRLSFVAESEVDAVQLAALFNGWRDATGRVQQMRKEALLRYCRENNVTITVEGQ